jgi:pyruvate formate lyase activating enzyme
VGAPPQPDRDGTILCGLCGRRCRLGPDQWGFCLSRKNQDGRITDPYYGLLSGLALDPIEKKPLYHFFPGHSILSAGFYGCSFRCPFCQNHGISQFQDLSLEKGRGPGEPPRPRGSFFLSPEDLAERAVREGSFGIAYTYSEPLIHYEYVLDASQAAHKRGLKNVLVTNGCLEEAAAEELLRCTDAANVDLKSFNPDFYREELKGDLETVKRFITLAHDRIHLEITTLILPGKNDSPGEIRELSGFIASLDPEIPLHLSAYFPRYHYTLLPTTKTSLLALVKVAKENLHRVYPGNI